MQKLRLSILGILLHLTFFFNLERIDIGQENTLDIQTFVYVIAFLAAFSVIAIPNLWRSNIALGYILWLIVYLLVKFWFNPSDRVAFGSINTYITITEIAMLTLTIMLTHGLAVRLYDAEETIKSIMMIGVSQRVRVLDEALEDIDIELYRSRRNHMPLSVIVMDVADKDTHLVLNQAVEEIIQSTRKHYISMSLARVIRKGLRRTDILLHQVSAGRFVLLSPETDADKAGQVIERIKSIATKELQIEPQFGVATFPEDALTFNELLGQAEEELLQIVEKD